MYGKTVGKWIFALSGLVLMSTAALGQRKFDHVKYLKPWTKGQRKIGHPVNGSVVFDSDKKMVEFLDKKSVQTISIPTEEITAMFVDTKAPPLYRPFQMVPNEYSLTMEYTDTDRTEKSVAIILDKRNLRDVLAAAAAETGKEVFHVNGCCRF